PELKEWFESMRKQKATQKVVGKNELGFPSRLWTFLAQQSGVKDNMNWADLPAAVRNRFIANLTMYPCEVKGKTTFKEEFVTAGGIKTNEIDVNTMMSKKIPGLFFAGEVLDVDGVTGGFNFQHAWTSGYIAAKTASIF
ncbi:MAG TPA: NAD(P)/FAD-dependent oxidoreductase, partial [Chitinophagaceae bacterium]|nr:NAD(P)/FAD-dependent oxidoreductase [Chitinophagaceae bacterium]